MKAVLLAIGLALLAFACAPAVSEPVPTRPPWVCFAKGASGEWTLRSRSGSFPDGSCHETLSLAFELPADETQDPRQHPRGADRLAFCGEWGDVLVEKAYAEINSTGQPELDWICGFGCVLRPADWDPTWGSWTLSWGRTEGGQVEELRVYLDPIPVRDESAARQLRYVRARRS